MILDWTALPPEQRKLLSEFETIRGGIQALRLGDTVTAYDCFDLVDTQLSNKIYDRIRDRRDCDDALSAIQKLTEDVTSQEIRVSDYYLRKLGLSVSGTKVFLDKLREAIADKAQGRLVETYYDQLTCHTVFSIQNGGDRHGN